MAVLHIAALSREEWGTQILKPEFHPKTFGA